MGAMEYKKLTDLENLHENPFNTSTGQLPISVVESYWERKSREGQRVFGYYTDKAVNDTGFTDVSFGCKPELGKRLFIKTLTVSATIDWIFYFKLTVFNARETGASGYVNSMPTILYLPMYILAKTPLIFNYDGGFWLEEGMELIIRGKGLTAETAGFMCGGYDGWEVAVDA